MRGRRNMLTRQPAQGYAAMAGSKQIITAPLHVKAEKLPRIGIGTE